MKHAEWLLRAFLVLRLVALFLEGNLPFNKYGLIQSVPRFTPPFDDLDGVFAFKKHDVSREDGHLSRADIIGVSKIELRVVDVKCGWTLVFSAGFGETQHLDLDFRIRRRFFEGKLSFEGIALEV